MVEDFLDTIDVSLERLRDEFSGGWLFGYIEALKCAGVDTDLICVSARIDEPLWWRHRPTGAGIGLLPATRIYRSMRRHLVDPYAWTNRAAVGDATGGAFAAGLLARHLAPYCATPVRLLSRTVRAKSYDAIICQEYEYPRFDVCVGLGKLLGVPVFASFQGGVFQMTALEPVIRPHAMRACQGVIIGPRGEAERVRSRYRLPRHHIARIFNPLDATEWGLDDGSEARRELGIEAEALVVAWHGRIDIHRKGLDVLVEAWLRLSHVGDFPKRRLLLIGTGTDALRLHDVVRDRRLADVVWLDEYILDHRRLRYYLSAADVYVFPSRHEGFPVAPLEAMACGLPLVATDAPGVREILENAEESGGVIVPPGDSAALARGLETLLIEDAWRQELGRRARRRVETAFSLETVGRQLRDFLEDRTKQY